MPLAENERFNGEEAVVAEDIMLRVIEFNNGARLIVEAEDVGDEIPATLGNRLDVPARRKGIPEGAEPVSTINAARKAVSLLEDQMNGLGALARLAVESTGPSEMEIQATVKFAGAAEVIPFLVSAKGEGGLKLTLKWKKGSDKAQI